MRKVKITGYLLLFLCIIGALIHSAMKNTRSMQRDIPTLLNFYYGYKDSDPLKAKEALDLILKQDPGNQTALQANINWYIQRGDTHSALIFLQQQHAQHPDNVDVTYELAELYLKLEQFNAAKPLLTNLMASSNLEVQNKARVLFLSVFPQEPVETVTATRPSYIAPVHFVNKMDLAPLYRRVQEVMTLQPDSARQYLHMIISIDPDAREAYIKLGYLELDQKRPDLAQQYFLKAFSIKPDSRLAVQLGYLLAQKKDREQALFFFNYGVAHGNDTLKQQSLQALAYLEQANVEPPAPAPATLLATPAPLSPEEQLWAQFYENKSSHPELAQRIINSLLRQNPNDLRTLKEAAYLAMAQHQTDYAIRLWKQAYFLERNPEYALSIAYLYDGMGNKPKAFRFFDKASQTTNPAMRQKAELAMTNMGGTRFQFLPKPYFAEVYTAPFYFSRFDLGVLPSIMRAGVTLEEKHRTEPYVTYRRTKDNRSGTLEGLIIQNSISQIFEDNVAIYAVGLRSYLWPNIPLQSFIEFGAAQDLVYRERPSWERDVRGGLVYYNAWGAAPTWTEKLTFPWKWVSTLYADTIYYSRYDNNIIGTAWFRPGMRVATYQSASLDLYLANYLTLDKNHEFYNNAYTLGPGIAFRPSNRLNVVFRLEALQGYYIPVNSPTPNPYRSRYWNNLAMMEVYFRF